MSSTDLKFPTRDVLREVGFKQTQTGTWTLCDSESVVVKATEGINTKFCPVLRVSGFVAARTEMAQIDQEIPEMSDSREQALAYLRFALEPMVSIVFPEEKSAPAWLLEGLMNRDLLPWERRRAAIENESTCSVSRDWARLALRTLAAQIEAERVATSATFRFDGEILTIRCGGNVVVAPASGKAWTSEVTVALAVLKELPKRLMRSMVTFSASEDCFTVGSCRYPRIETQLASQSAAATRLHRP